MDGLHDEQWLQISKELLPSPDRILGAGQTGFTMDLSDQSLSAKRLPNASVKDGLGATVSRKVGESFGLRAIDPPTGYNLHVK
jgi:hypothetical protein